MISGVQPMHKCAADIEVREHHLLSHPCHDEI